MADFTALKSTIQNYIKQNGNEEITGNILQEVLLAMVQTMGDGAINDLVTALAGEVTARQNADGTLQTNINNEATARGNADTALGGRIDGEITNRQNADTALQNAINTINTKLAEGYVYAGIATTSTNPSTPTGKVFYIATAAGTYTNFLDSNSAALVVTQGINILKFDGTSWSQEQIWAVDDEPINNSNALAKSKSVYNVKESVEDLQKGLIEHFTQSNYDSWSGLAKCLNINDGTLNDVSYYATTRWVKLPEFIKKIVHNFSIPVGGYAGWCIYDKDVNILSSQDQHEHFLVGGKSSVIENIPSNAGYIRFTTEYSQDVHGIADLPVYQYSFYIGDFQQRLLDLFEEIISVTPQMTSGKGIKYATGEFFNVTGYVCTDYLEIPLMCGDILTNITPDGGGVDGWCLFEADKTTLVAGGKTQRIPVNKYPNARYIVLSGMNYDISPYKVVFYIGKNYDENRDSDSIVTEVPVMIKQEFVNSSTGAVANVASDTLARTRNFITIPYGTKYLRHNCNTNSINAVGYVFVDEVMTVKGYGVSVPNVDIPIPEGAIAFMVSDFNESETHNIVVKFVLDNTVGDITDSLSEIIHQDLVVVDRFINKNNGKFASHNLYSGTDYIEIPVGCSDITHDMTPNIDNGADGWCLYDEGKRYIVGGQTQRIPVSKYPDAKYVALSGLKYADQTAYHITFYIGESFNVNRKADIVSTVHPLLYMRAYVNGNNGNFADFGGDEIAMSRNAITIPYGTRLIRTNANGYNNVLGYLFVDEKMTKLSYGLVDRNKGLLVPNGAVGIVVSDFDDNGVHDFEVQFVMQEIPFIGKNLAFDGDSITYGYDESADHQLTNPWPYQVGEKLFAKNCVNYGVSSATLMDGRTSGGDPTPHAVVTEYTNISNDTDILGIMIGINDYFRQNLNPEQYKDYPLGTMSDRTASTFYGALHVLILGLLAKFPPINDKHIFFMIYPYYERSYVLPQFTIDWETYMDAVREVCAYYAIPILDLEKELGISMMGDVNGVYWGIVQDGTNSHDVHPTQDGADIFATCIANFIARMFSIK